MPRFIEALRLVQLIPFSRARKFHASGFLEKSSEISKSTIVAFNKAGRKSVEPSWLSFSYNVPNRKLIDEPSWESSNEECPCGKKKNEECPCGSKSNLRSSFFRKAAYVFQLAAYYLTLCASGGWWLLVGRRHPFRRRKTAKAQPTRRQKTGRLVTPSATCRLKPNRPVFWRPCLFSSW